MKKLDYLLVAPGLCVVATCYGLARYAYGLFLPIFRQELAISEAWLAYIAAFSYASYFLITLFISFFYSLIKPRTSLLWGGLCAVAGMLLIASSQSVVWLAIGVCIAGISPGLAYTPFSSIIVNLVSPSEQKTVYSIINSGTSLGVMISGPIALLMGDNWRYAWVFFALFGLASTLWCVSLIPQSLLDSVLETKEKISFISLLKLIDFGVLFLIFLIGVSTSIYWTYAVDLVTQNQIDTSGWISDGKTLGQLFWMLVGIAGFAGIFAGRVVNYLGSVKALIVFQICLAFAMACLPATRQLEWVILSGLLFGAFFVLMAGNLGMWSIELYPKNTTLGFGLTFLTLSFGQFTGPFLVGLMDDTIHLKTLFYLASTMSLMVGLMLLVSLNKWRLV